MPKKVAKPTSPVTAQMREQHGLLRVAALSPELTLGNVDANVQAILAAARPLVLNNGARLVVCPELCLTGYSCADLFYLPALREAAIGGLWDLAQATADWQAVVVVGLPLEVQDRLYNVAAVIAGGEILGIVPKTHLPNAGEFYERRWFSPAMTVGVDTVSIVGAEVPFGTDLIFSALDIPGLRIGVEICEDLWSVIPPSSSAALAGATVLVNLSASNELLGKAPYRRALVEQQSARCLAAYVYAGAGPGESSTDLVFGGHCLIAENGMLLGETERFVFGPTSTSADVDLHWLRHDRLQSAAFRDAAAEVAMRVIPFELGAREKTPKSRGLLGPLPQRPFVPSVASARADVCQEIFAIQATGLARRLKASHAKTAVLGLSGGLDSTLALLVIVEALKLAGLPANAALTITMPGFGTTDRTKGNAEKLAEALGVPLRTIPISDSVKQHFADIGHPEGRHDVVYENSQARERTQVLMDVANQTGGIVVGTGDLSEAALGWCTFNGDHISMYHVNAGVPKTLVRYLIQWCAEELHKDAAGAILHDIIDTPITPELLPLGKGKKLQQKTEDTVGPYELHDFFLFHLVRRGASSEKLRWLAGIAFADKYAANEIDKWLALFLRRFAQNQFKRSVMPDGPKVGSVALSPRGDWRMPSDLPGVEPFNL